MSDLPNRDQRLMRAFDKAALTAEASAFKRPDQWQTYQEITNRAQTARERADSIHTRNYHERVEQELARRVSERVKMAPILRLRHMGIEAVSLAQIKVEAAKAVDLRQAMRKLRIDAAEESLKASLMYGRSAPDRSPSDRPKQTR